jgi:hypothetical protein
MIAKRNAEVRELNAMAREKMRAEAKLGAEEIKSARPASQPAIR